MTDAPFGFILVPVFNFAGVIAIMAWQLDTRTMAALWCGLANFGIAVLVLFLSIRSGTRRRTPVPPQSRWGGL